jgi:hypothetical protein
LAESNKSQTGGKATKKRTSPTPSSVGACPGNVAGVVGHFRTTAERGLGPGTPGWVYLNHLADCQ